MATDLEYARLRDDYRRLSEAWKALSERTHTKSEPGVVVTHYEVADFPYPREWELEDSEKDEACDRKDQLLSDCLDLFERAGLQLYVCELKERDDLIDRIRKELLGGNDGN